ncbi:hypothetical protein DH2020_041063 [Rehmannia glutinosa]|uniref:Uncharacterized protein n=1 Tax=Rehmannia glutinosa TaxID=99300 RepID=A0ABR0USE2_REHGL
MASWVRTITSPFRKACTFFNHQNHHRDKKSQQGAGGQEQRIMDLHGEVMACAYEDVQVMWSILDKSKPRTCALTS